MTAIQKQITVTDVAFDQLDDRAMTAKATLRIGNVTYSYLTIDAVLSDDLRIKIMGLIETELGKQLDATPGTLPRSPAHRELETA
jgi:hypothetical protein